MVIFFCWNNLKRCVQITMRVLVPESAFVVMKNDLLQLWHERMDHQYKRYVQIYLKSKGIVVKLDNEFCDACMYVKMHRLSFRSGQNGPSSPGQLVHAGVCGPMPEKSLGDKRYFVAFKDDYYKYRTVYLIKRKSEFKKYYLDFYLKRRNEGYMLKELLTDGGGEFNNSEVH
ncbi:Retrovirus-related Pol polyprotein from transposon TNT 1-94 [Araneus ventricosus]|uniref:Retrovirus-related Pol polyprotein from transposon TNT 1-94 n=1 Tax=Araneus ventricosus TaxID=182803 RepID=A0A4Y2D2I6_ARAVE|nr:Retrovirus-related Pol polyprotein from transposon TNT 1-94 [Araneus ventricosus]